MTNKKYRKHNGQFARRYEGLPLAVGYLFLALCLASVLMYLYKKPLVSPVVENWVTPVQAKEEVYIPCEKGVAEYLECQVIKGELTEKEAKTMLAIAKAESGLKETARNSKSTARGVFQIIAGTWYNYDCIGDKYDWKDNTKCAIKIMKRSGFTQWESYTNKSYLKYL